MLFFSPEGSVVRDDFNAVTLAPVPQTDICPTHCSTPPKAFIIWSAAYLPFKQIVIRVYIWFSGSRAVLTLFLVRSDVKWLEIKQQAEGSVNTGGWDTPRLIRAIKKKNGGSYVVERMPVCSTLSPKPLSCCSLSSTRGWALQHKRGSLYLKATGEIKE